ncbi:Clavaminate synthase-like protein [Amylostereum chailletii]|nr:Clavaminate synthase-like protein [Amylostereum chailletii]
MDTTDAIAALPHEAHLETLEWISAEYHGLNGTQYKTLQSPPSAVEFSRISHISRPVLIQGHIIPGVQSWSDEYISSRMGNAPISVAVTPNGYADAVTRGPDDQLYFVEPFVQHMTMSALLAELKGTRGSSANARDVHYLQSQNGNLFSSAYFDSSEGAQPELAPLRSDVPPEISWCSEALGRTPDAVNLWIGNDRSTTSIHSDPYENIYHVVRGCKIFTLLPPTEGWCLQERLYPHATYSRDDCGTLVLTPSTDIDSIRWSSVLHPERERVLPSSAHPITIMVHAGETMYLPAGWWHHVQQRGDITIALNWWYDIEPEGMSWVWLSLLRGPREVQPANGETSDLPIDIA